jgi:hypothetical protein
MPLLNMLCCNASCAGPRSFQAHKHTGAKSPRPLAGQANHSATAVLLHPQVTTRRHHHWGSSQCRRCVDQLLTNDTTGLHVCAQKEVDMLHAFELTGFKGAVHQTPHRQPQQSTRACTPHSTCTIGLGLPADALSTMSLTPQVQQPQQAQRKRRVFAIRH